MISNERIRRLIDTDRDALIALMAFARADGATSGAYQWEFWNDTEVRRLIEQTRRENRIVTRAALDDWNDWAQSPEQ